MACLLQGLKKVRVLATDLERSMKAVLQVAWGEPVATADLERILAEIPERAISPDLHMAHARIQTDIKTPTLTVHWHREPYLEGQINSWTHEIEIHTHDTSSIVEKYAHERFHTTQNALSLQLEKNRTPAQKLEAKIQFEREACQYQIDVIRYLRAQGHAVTGELADAADALKAGRLLEDPGNLKAVSSLDATVLGSQLRATSIPSEAGLIEALLQGRVFYEKTPGGYRAFHLADYYALYAKP